MKPLAAFIPSLPLRERCLMLLLGPAVGLFLVTAGALPPKWFIFLLFSLLALACLVILPAREKFLLYLSVIFMTVILDFHPIYLESATTPWPVSGWRVSLFDLTFFALLLIWMFRLVLDPAGRVRFFPGISLPFLLLWLLAVLSTGRADLPFIIKCSTIWMVLESWLIFLYFANKLQERGLLAAVIIALLASGVLQALLGLGQFLSGGTLGLNIFGEAKTFMEMKAGDTLVSRVSGTLGHPNNLAGYLCMVLQINLALFFAPLRRNLRLSLAAAFVLMATALVLTLSRGGWLAFCLGTMLTIFLALSRRWGHGALSLVWAVLLMVIFLVTTVALVEPLKRRFFEEDYGAAQARMPLAKVALNMIRQHPWLGVGQTAFVAAAPQYDTSREAISFTFPRPVHNEFLLIGAELGLPALGLFLAILVTLWRRLWGVSRDPEESPLPYVAIGLLGAFAAWTAFRLTDFHYVLLADPLWILAGLSQALAARAPGGATAAGARGGPPAGAP